MASSRCCDKKKKKSSKMLYSEEFQALLDRLEEEDNYDEEEVEEEEDEELENGSRRRKRKRKLSPDQVKALEASFKAERRLGLPRKAAIAAELGLEPRQVAVWFQNRRARSKSKHLEKEFSRLQAVYAELRRDYDSLERETQSLVAEVKDLEARVEEANSIGSKESNVNVAPVTAASVSPTVTDTMIEYASPPPMSSLWAMDDAYVAGQQHGVLLDCEFGRMTPSSSAWDFYEFDQAFFF